MKTPETYEGPRRLILEDPAVLIGCCAVRLPLGQPAACAADYPFGLAFGSTADSHRLPTRVGCQLAPTADFRRPPTCVGCQPSGVAFQLNLRLSSASDPTAPSNRSAACAADQSSGLPSDRSPACAFDRPSGPAFRTTCDLRRRSTLRLRLLTGPRLAPPADPSAMPSDEPPACAFDPSSGSTFQSTSSLRLRFDLPALPLNLTSDSHRSLHRRLRLVPTSGLRLRSTLGCAFGPASDRRRVPTFQLCLPDGLRLAPTANLPALPSKQLPTPVNCCALGAAVRSTVDLRHRSTVRPCL